MEFAAQGYHAASMRDIARAVGLTQPMLYYHVGNKEAFLSSICESLLELHINAVSYLADDDGPAADRLAKFFERELAEADQHRAEITVYLRERLTLPPALKQKLRGQEKTLEGVLRAILEDGVESGDLVFESLEITAGAIWAILNRASAMPARDDEDAMAVEVYARKLSSIVIDGIRRQPPTV